MFFIQSNTNPLLTFYLQYICQEILNIKNEVAAISSRFPVTFPLKALMPFGFVICAMTSEMRTFLR